MIYERKASLETRALAAMSKNVDAAYQRSGGRNKPVWKNAILAEEQVLTNSAFAMRWRRP